MTQTDHAEFVRVLREFRTGMLVTHSSSGLHARPMGLARVDDDGDIWFVTGTDTDKFREVQADGDANLVCQDAASFVSLTGRCEVVRDRTKVDELWKELFRVWFPKGKTDPMLALICFHTADGEYWDYSGTKKIQYLFSAAKAFVKGERPVTKPDMHWR